MATTPSLAAQAAQAQRELAVATKTLAAAQNTVIAAQKAGRTPSPAALAAVESATTAVKSTQLASNNATAAVTSAAGKTPPSTGPGVPDSLASAGNRNGGVSPLVDPANKQLPYNVSTPSPSTGSMLSNPQGLLNTVGAAALGAAVANPLATLALASKIGDFFKSTKDVVPASTAVPKSAPAVNPAADNEFGNLAAAQATAADRAPDTQSPEDIQAGLDDAFANQLQEEEGPPTDISIPVDAASDEELSVLESFQQDQRNALVDTDTPINVGDPTTLEGFGVQEAFDPTTLDGFGLEPVDPVDPVVSNITQLSDEEAAALFAEADAVDPGEDPELQEPPGTDPVFTDLAEPVDPDADPELLGDPDLQDGEITDLAEPVDPDADPELVQLGGPTEEDELVQLSGPTDVDPNTSGTGFGDDPGDAALFDQRAEQDLAAQQSATLDKARAQNTIANQRKNANNADWRVKLRLAPQADYLYAAPQPGILQPLKDQGGVIFPYTPAISTAYKANYSSYDLTHSNYKGYYYQGSAVDAVTLSCPFTAQSTVEADYLLAVIHFFKSVTKMFYGQDSQRGTPPPLVYLTGLGEYQFNEHPCVVSSFTYTLPTDVDYIRARSPNINNSNMLNQRQGSNGSTVGTTWGGGILGPLFGGAINRLANAGLPKGGRTTQPAPATFGLNSPTYVPTKIEISISLLPVQSRKQQSQDFSLRQYANGDLLKGGFW